MKPITTAIILSAGKGKRMVSSRQKTLHEVLGRPMLRFVLDAVAPLVDEPAVVVTGFDGCAVEECLGSSVRYAAQKEALGTADAVRAARHFLQGKTGMVFVVYGSEPAVTMDTLDKLAHLTENCDGATVDGRGVFCFQIEKLLEALPRIGQGKDGEFHLEEIAAILNIKALPSDSMGGVTVRDCVDLSACEASMRRCVNEDFMRKGVTMIDPDRAYIGAEVTIGADTVIHPGVELGGKTVIGRGVTLLPGCRIHDSVIGDDCTLLYVSANCARLGNRVTVGPFVNLRPGAMLSDGVKVGDFVEIKNSNIGEGTKVPHLTYVGDADVGRRVNVGCGTVFVNYNGYRKSRTIVGDDVFLGCQTNLVAPVTVGDGAFTAAGSTITDDVPAGSLAIAREKQTNKPGWVEQYKKLNGK